MTTMTIQLVGFGVKMIDVWKFGRESFIDSLSFLPNLLETIEGSSI